MAIAQAIIFHRQWKAMNNQLGTMQGQLAEMKTTSSQLDKLIEQATQNAKAGQSSASAAQESAEAATKSANALINIERPWIQVLTSRVEIPPLPHSASQPFVHIWPRICSVGRTPVRTKWVVFKAHLIPSDSNLPFPAPPPLPEKPDYSGGVSVEKRCFIRPDTGIEPMPVNITVEEWAAVQNRELFLYVYGVVHYCGIGAAEYVTGFCDIYWVPYGASDPQPEGFLTSANIPDAYFWSG